MKHLYRGNTKGEDMIPAQRNIIIIACIGLALILALSLSLSSLHINPFGTAGGITVTDDFGRNVTLKNVPERIVSLAPSSTEILFAIGAGDRVVGVTDYCNYPKDAESRTRIGGVSTVSVEKVIALRPDLVIGCRMNGKDVFERLQELGIPVAGLDAKDIDGVFADIMLVGKLTGEEANASAIVSDMKNRLDRIKAQTAHIKERPRVFYNIGDLWTAGAGTFLNEIIEIAGGDNIAADKDGYYQMSLEELIDKNPQVIICDSGMGGMSPAYEEIMKDDRLKIVDAVRNNRVYLIDGDLIDRPGPRIVNGVEIIYSYLWNSTDYGST